MANPIAGKSIRIHLFEIKKKKEGDPHPAFLCPGGNHAVEEGREKKSLSIAQRETTFRQETREKEARSLFLSGTSGKEPGVKGLGPESL
jgi:hypothetical protein